MGRDKFQFGLGEVRIPEIPSERDGYGIFIRLNRKDAKVARGFKIDDKDIADLQRLGRERVIWRLNTRSRPMVTPYEFFEDSLLVKSVAFGGDGCSLGIEHRELTGLEDSPDDEPVVYTPKNVDHIVDSYALLALFSLWAQYAPVVMRTKT